MNPNHLLVFAIAALILFSSSVPVYASHVKKVEPTADEKRLFEKIFTRLEAHRSKMEVQIEDVKKSFSEPAKIFFSCRPFEDKAVQSVSVSVKTQFASFDRSISEKHKTGILTGMYVWDCTAVKDRYTITIECVNQLMLNPTFLIKEEIETDENRNIAMVENEMVLYHEFLHGELMMDAMKDVNDNAGWRKDACSFFAGNDNKLHYAPSDADHKIISTLELDYLGKIVKEHGGMLIITTIDRNNVGNSEFEKLVATFDELGVLANRGFFVFARAVNMEEIRILVSSEKETIEIFGSLEDDSIDGFARIFVMPKKTVSSVKLSLDVADALKNNGSEFIFTVTVQNQQGTDISGTIRLGIDGEVVASQDVDVLASREQDLNFIWKSSDLQASKHTVTIDGFNAVSNEVIVFTFDKKESRTVKGSGTVTDQVIVDPYTKEIISVARPNRISGMIIIDHDDIEVQLLAPYGTTVIGKNALVDDVGSRVHIVKVNDQTLAVKYTELNEKLRFFAVKTTVRDLPLPSGEWSIKTIDSNGNNADSRIKYYVNYVGSS